MKNENSRFKAQTMRAWETTLSGWEDLKLLATNAFCQISDFLHLRLLLGRTTPKQPSTVDLNVQHAAVKRDLAQAEPPAGHIVHQKALRSETEPGRGNTNREAIERGENEGMMVPSEQEMARRRESGTAS